MKHGAPLLVLAATVAACGAGRCATPAVAEPAVISVLTWSDYFGKTTLERFTKTTGIKVQVTYADSNEEMVAKVESQPTEYDVVFPSAYAVEMLVQKRILHPIDRAGLRNIGNLIPAYSHIATDPEGRWAIPYTVSYTALAVNTTAWTKPVDSYQVLLDPALRDRVLLLDDMRATLGLALRATGHSANSVQPQDLSDAEAFLGRVRPQLHVFASSDLQQLMASGEVTVSDAWSGDILQAGMKNSAVRMALPKEGPLLYIDCMAIPAGSRHKSNAQRFIDHLLEGDVAAGITNDILYLVPNDASRPLLTPAAQRLWSGLEELQHLTNAEPVRYLGDATKRYSDAWTRIKTR